MSLSAVTSTLRGRTRVPTWAYRTLSVLLYFVLTSWLYGWAIFDNSKIIGAPGADMAQEVWFLAWPAYALTHGHSLFITNYMNYPHGLNLMANTSMPLLGLLGAPITWIFGPVVTFTLFMRLGFILSAASAQFVARRVGLSRSAGVVAGLLYGFSTAQLVEGHGHMFLVFAPIPPLVFYGVFCLFVNRWSARRAGLTVGVLIALDFLISAERALMTVVGLAVVLVVAAVIRWRQVTLALVRRVVEAGAWALGAMIVLLIYPISQMQGRDHISDVSHPWIQGYHTDLAGLFLPDKWTWLDVFGAKASIIANVNDIWENGAYLGIPLILVLIGAVVVGRRKPLVAIGAISTVLVIGLSLGEVLTIDGHLVHWHHLHDHLPYKVFAELKYLQNIEPVRFMYIAWIGVALLAGYGFDRLVRWRRSAQGTAGVTRAGAVAAVCASVVLTLVPGQTYLMPNIGVPSWFASAQAQSEIPSGGVVLFYPYPTLMENHAMLDQVVAGFRFKIIGGEALVGAHGVSVGINPLAPKILPSVFIRTWLGQPTGPIVKDPITLPPLPPNDAKTAAAMNRFVTVHHVDALIVEMSATNAAKVLPYLRAAFGAPTPRAHGALDVWLFHRH